MKITRNKAFTLVELIVVITILAILGTIAFLSMQGYSSNARDSNRTTDLSSIKTSLELHITKTGNYPLPSNYVGVTYSGGLVWNQGTFGNEPFRQLGDINKLPTDPLTSNEYTYSVTNTKTEYEISGVYEGNIAKNKNILNDTYAVGTLQGTTKILGTYNGVQIHVSTGTNDFTIFTPTITSSDLIISVDIQNIITNNKLVLNGSTKLPSSYQSSSFKDGSVSLGLTNILISTGSIGELKAKTASGTTLRQEYLNNLKSILSGSTIENNYKEVINNPTDTLALNIINSKYKPGVSSSIVAVNSSNNNNQSYNCTGTLPTSNYTTQTGTLTENTAWQNTTSGNPCYYECTNGYTGNDCSTAPNPYLSCTTSGQIKYVISGVVGTSSTGLTCSDDIIVCSGNGTGYVLSACNAGATTVYTNQTFSSQSVSRNSTINSWAGGLYQWGNNSDVSYASTSGTTSTCTSNSIFSQNVFIISYTGDWCSTQTDDVWGGISGSNIDRRGPCQAGYHVPTYTEWQGIYTAGGWGTSGTNMKNALKLPFAGNRWYNDSMGDQGTSGSYWSSSPYDTYANYLCIYSNSIDPCVWVQRANGFSVRCMKN